MKKLLTVACALVAANANANVLITEYVEGSGYNKVIEISNLGENEVKLGEQNYTLSLYTNGSDTPSKTMELFGVLPSGASLVLHNKGFEQASNFASPLGMASNDVINHNGDDAFVLKKGEQIVDSFGQVGTDPGKFWGTDDNNSQDHTLRRVSTVVTGDTTISDTVSFDGSQWAFFDKNTFDGLGCAGENACSGEEAKPTEEAGAVVDTCIFTTCSEIEKVRQKADFVDSEYYSKAYQSMDSSTAAFRQSLHQDIKAGHTQLTYNQVWTALLVTDEDPNNSDNVILLYTGKSINKAENASVNNNSDDSWNREHVWSKSHGFPDIEQLGYTDIHHLRPSDASINSARSNYDFDNGGDIVYDGDIATNNNLNSGTSWEPRDEVKGDVARMMFYMDLRYEDGSDQDMPDLRLIDEVNTSGSDFGKLCTLLEWHETDSVDVQELKRNDDIFEFQGNRNPFIDHPEWVETLYGPRCGENPQPMPVVNVGDVTVNSGEAVSLSVDNLTEGQSIKWEQESGTTVSISGETSANLTFTAPNVSVSETLVIKVTVTDSLGIQASDKVRVRVNTVASESAESSGGGGAFSAWLLLLLSLSLMRRKP